MNSDLTPLVPEDSEAPDRPVGRSTALTHEEERRLADTAKLSADNNLPLTSTHVRQAAAHLFRTNPERFGMVSPFNKSIPSYG